MRELDGDQGEERLTPSRPTEKLETATTATNPMTAKDRPETIVAGLAAMPVQDRIDSVARDLTTRKDHYAGVVGYQLAELLGLEPDQLEGWPRVNFVEQIEPSTFLKNLGYLSTTAYERLRDAVSTERLAEIDSAIDRSAPRESLSQYELSLVIEKEEQNRLEEDGLYIPLAERSAFSSAGLELAFQAVVEDDGILISVLTPYDRRDGNFYDYSGRPQDHF